MTAHQQVAIDRETLTRIYSEHMPEKVDQIDQILLKRLGNTKAMREMYQFLSKKFDINCDAIREDVANEIRESSSSQQQSHKRKTSTAEDHHQQQQESIEQPQSPSTTEEKEIIIPGADVVLEISLTVAVVGAQGCGKSSIVKALLKQSSMDRMFDESTIKQDDDNIDAAAAAADATTVPEKKTKNDDGGAAAAAEDEASPRLPSSDSFGVNFRSGAFSAQPASKALKQFTSSSSSSSSAACVLRLECFELGGATCSGELSDPTVVYQTVAKCDVVVVAYDLCDKASLAPALTEDLLPILEATKVPIIVVGNKIDRRKKLTPEQRKSAVAKADQTQLDTAIAELNAVTLGSVAATSPSGVGMLRLRRQIVFDALQKKQAQIESALVFDDGDGGEDNTKTFWDVIEDQVGMLSKCVVQRRYRFAKTPAAAAASNKEDAPSQRRRYDEDEAAAGRNKKSKEPLSPGKEEDGGDGVPVIDASSSKKDKKKDKEDGGEDDDDPDKGKGVMCGCQSCVIC